MKLFEAIKTFFRSLLFLLRTGHLPETYRKLFRDLSSCYLTPAAPGKAMMQGYLVECITNLGAMILKIGETNHYIDRTLLLVGISELPPKMPIWAPKARTLKKILDGMLKDGIPYKISDVGITYLESDLHTVKVNLKGGAPNA